MDLSSLIQLKNRPGVFAVVSPETAKKIREGYWTLYWVENVNQVCIETVTRTRRHLTNYDPYYRLVFVALDQNNKLTISV